MTKKNFLVTNFYVMDDGAIVHGAPCIMHSEASKDIFVEALKTIYEAMDVEYHIYVEELVDGRITKRIQHISSNKKAKS